MTRPAIDAGYREAFGPHGFDTGERVSSMCSVVAVPPAGGLPVYCPFAQDDPIHAVGGAGGGPRGHWLLGLGAPAFWVDDGVGAAAVQCAGDPLADVVRVLRGRPGRQLPQSCRAMAFVAEVGMNEPAVVEVLQAAGWVRRGDGRRASWYCPAHAAR